MKFSPQNLILALAATPILGAPREVVADTAALAETTSNTLNAAGDRGVIMCPDTNFSPGDRKSTLSLFPPPPT
jgi:hypothetical protein